MLERCGASIVGQTKNLVPADRKLYSLRDRTATVENPYLICASIMSKKLAAGLDALVIDVKTGSGAFLRNEEDAQYLAALMVETGERAGTRTVAVLTDMSQPLGRMAGNWVEIQESMELLRGERNPLSEDLREVSLILAGWMIYLGGKARSAEAGQQNCGGEAEGWIGAGDFSRDGGGAGRRCAGARCRRGVSHAEVSAGISGDAERIFCGGGLHEDRMGGAAAGRGAGTRGRAGGSACGDSRCM